jgi:hypothetical protein
MQTGFVNTRLKVETGDGIDDVLLEALVYVRADGSVVRCPVGGTTDGLSVPRCVQNVIPATGGDWFSGVLHDSAYRDQMEVYSAGLGGWVKGHYTKRMCDELLLEAMESQGVGAVMRRVIYWGVKYGGPKSFREDRMKA